MYMRSRLLYLKHSNKPSLCKKEHTVSSSQNWHAGTEAPLRTLALSAKARQRKDNKLRAVTIFKNVLVCLIIFWAGINSYFLRESIRDGALFDKYLDLTAGPTMGDSLHDAEEVCLGKMHAALDKPRPPPLTELENENDPLVCIVMTTFNVEAHVERSLQSIRHQTHSNFEVLVVDDASTDSTRDKINHFVQMDHRFDLVHLKHNTAGGTGQPTNIGLDSCSKDAEYILIADGNFWMERDALELLLLDARRFNSDMVIADFDTFVQQGYSSGCNGKDMEGSSLDLFNRTSIEHFCDQIASSLWPFEFMASYDLDQFKKLPTERMINYITHPDVLRISPVPWRKLYHRSFIERFGLRFPEGDYFFEDNAFHWKTVFYARRITKVDRILFHHMRNREGQTTESMTMNERVEGRQDVQVTVGDIIFAKWKYGDKEDDWSWHQASVDATHLDYDDNQTKYVVAYLSNGEISMGLQNRDILPLDDERYWKSYYGVARLSGIVANIHSIGETIISGLMESDVCAQVAVATFAQEFLKKIHDSRWIADRKFSELYGKLNRKLQLEYEYWKSVMINAGFQNKFGIRTRHEFGDKPLFLPINGRERVDLSIIIPTKDVSPYIEDLLQKMYDDLTRSNIVFEVFVVDDGSTDGTLQILRKFAVKHISNFYLLESGTGSGAGRARNHAIKGLIEGEYVYFADSDDTYDFLALAKATRIAQKSGSDLVIFPYKVEFVRPQLSEIKGMMKADQRIWDHILTEQKPSNIDLKLAALELISYPWKQLTASSLIDDAGIFFGPTEVQNDVQFHWTSIAAAQNIRFYNQPICTHRKFDSNVRKQLTQVQSSSRMSMLDAFGMTQRALALQGAFELKEGSQIFETYKKFFKSVTKWGASLVPKESLSIFNDRMNHFIKAHEQHKPQTLANWAYWKMDEGATHSVIGGGNLPGPTMGNSSRATEICLKMSHDILNIYRPPPMDLLDSESGPLVCIIVPTYNVEAYVERSLQSIRHQTYPNFQVVVVDDASTDSTRDKINHFVQMDHRFRLVHLKHNTAGGAGQPTNIGLDSCSKDAEYILIADGDDWMERDALESLLFDARRFHSDVVIADFDIFIQQDYSSGCNGTDLEGSSLDLFNRTSIENFCNETASAIWPFEFMASYDLDRFKNLPTEQVFTFFTHPSVLRTSPVSWRKLYRKSFIERFGLRFLEGDIFFEDNAFHWMTVFYARRITKVDRVLFHHMWNREGQVTSAMTSKQELMGSKTMQFTANDIVFAKLKYKRNWSWHQARLNAIHPGYDGDQTTYDVTYQFNGMISKDLNYTNLLSIDDTQYWMSYFGATRQSGIVANFHSIGHRIFSRLLLDDLELCPHLAVATFAQVFFDNLYAAQSYVADSRFPELYGKLSRKIQGLDIRWRSSLVNAGYEELKSSKQYTYGAKITSRINLVEEIELSIIMTTKDVSVYLPDFLRDMYNDLTSFNINFEVFAVDDGSTDGTLQILRKFAAEHSSNFYLLEAGNGNGAGRARNHAIKGLIEGEYVYFIDTDDSFDFRALGLATRTAKETGADLLILPYKREHVRPQLSEIKGMFKDDARIWNDILTKHEPPNIDLKLAALGLISYPWKQLTASSLIHDKDIFFGPTEVQNDVQFHWTSIAAAQNIHFYNQPICTHRIFESNARKQLTRMSMLDALGMTQRALAVQGAFNFEEGGRVFNAYKKFFKQKTTWAEKLVPDKYLPDFTDRKNYFITALEQQEPRALAKWAYWETEEEHIFSLIDIPVPGPTGLPIRQHALILPA